MALIPAADLAARFATLDAESDTAKALDAAESLWRAGVYAEDDNAQSLNPSGAYALGDHALRALLGRVFDGHFADEVRDVMADCLEGWRYCTDVVIDRRDMAERTCDRCGYVDGHEDGCIVTEPCEHSDHDERDPVPATHVLTEKRSAFDRTTTRLSCREHLAGYTEVMATHVSGWGRVEFAVDLTETERARMLARANATA